jgi:hypothetical protein
MRLFLSLALLLGIAFSCSGCVIVDRHSHCGYYHPC